MTGEISCTDSTELNQRIKYAGFWLRVIASLVDGLILAAVNFILDNLGFSGWFWFKWAIPLVYAVGFNSSTYQGTVGKIIVGIKITDLHGGRITIKRALARYGFPQIFLVFQCLCIIYLYATTFANNIVEGIIALVLLLIITLMLFIGYLMTAFTARKQALHDIVCGTLVVKSGNCIDFVERPTGV